MSRCYTSNVAIATPQVYGAESARPRLLLRQRRTWPPTCARDESRSRHARASVTLHDTLQNGIFNAGATARANVGEFMADLVTKPGIWQRWKNSFPHILDAAADGGSKDVRA